MKCISCQFSGFSLIISTFIKGHSFNLILINYLEICFLSGWMPGGTMDHAIFGRKHVELQPRLSRRNTEKHLKLYHIKLNNPKTHDIYIEFNDVQEERSNNNQ